MLLIPLRHPTITAMMVATLDRISNGRVLLLPAVDGDYPDEFESCGVQVRERAGRTNEALEIMRRLWMGEKVNFQGRYYRIKDATMQPAPVQPGGPPFWLAHRGRSDVATRRTTRLCQGWYASWVSPGRFLREWKRTLEYAQQFGRDPSTLTPAAIIRIYVADSKEEAVRRTTANRTDVYGHAGDPGLVEHLQCLGTPEQCAEKLQAYLDAGVTHVSIAVPAPREEREEQMKAIVREVLPRWVSPWGPPADRPAPAEGDYALDSTKISILARPRAMDELAERPCGPSGYLVTIPKPHDLERTVLRQAQDGRTESSSTVRGELVEPLFGIVSYTQRPVMVRNGKTRLVR